MGGRCSECERCDLYGDEDEGDAIKKAAEKAEKLWREKEGLEMGGQDEAATREMYLYVSFQTRLNVIGTDLLIPVVRPSRRHCEFAGHDGRCPTRGTKTR